MQTTITDDHLATFLAPTQHSPRTLPVHIVYTTLVTPQGDPRVKNLLDTKGFRRTVEHQASVEIGIQGGSLDWTNAVLDPPVTSEEIRMEEWKRLAGTQQPQVTIALKSLQPGETSPDPMLLQPGEESSATPDPMSTEPEVAREPTIADVMAIITHLRGEHESLRGEHERLRGEHSCELARLRRKHSCEFDKLNKKLSESNDEAANAYRKHSAEIEELQKTIATQSRCMNALMPRTLHIIHRKLLEWYRGKLFDQVGRLKGDTTKDLIARVRNKIPTELNLWVLERFSTLSKQFHSHPTEKEARIVLESNLDCKDKNYRKIFTVLFPEANALKDRGSNSTE